MLTSLHAVVVLALVLKTQAGPAPSVCPRRCLSTATCNTDKKQCECPDATHGDGSFECVPQDHVLCAIELDPHVVTWDGATTSVDLPCSFHLARFIAESCSLSVEARNELTPTGLFFVNTVEVHFATAGLTPTGGRVQIPGSDRQFTVSRQLIEQAGGENPWAGPEVETVEGVEIRKIWDADNRFAILDFPACGVRVKFRPYIPGQSPQVEKPGVTLSVPRNASFSPYSDRLICREPGKGPNSYEKIMEYYNFTNTEMAVLWMILEFQGFADIQNDSASCSALKQLYKKHPTKQILATNVCAFIFTDRGTLQCLQGKGLSPDDLFVHCVTWVFLEDKVSCETYTEAARDCPVTQHVISVGCDVTKLRALD